MHDIEQALNALENVVKDPEYCGPREYITTEGARCLVGEAWHSLGVPDETLLSLANLPVEALKSLNALPVMMTMGAVIVYRAAQNAQDEGLTWGQSLERAATHADRYINLLLTPQEALV